MIIVYNKLLDTTAYGLIKSKSNASIAGAVLHRGRQWPINGAKSMPRPHWLKWEDRWGEVGREDNVLKYYG